MVDVFFCDTSGCNCSSSRFAQNVWSCFQGSFYSFKIWYLTESSAINCDATLTDCNNCMQMSPNVSKHTNMHTPTYIHILYNAISGWCCVCLGGCFSGVFSQLVSYQDTIYSLIHFPVTQSLQGTPHCVSVWEWASVYSMSLKSNQYHSLLFSIAVKLMSKRSNWFYFF